MQTVTLDPEKFSIRTEQFEGPLELLIELVEKRKLLINDISLAAVTDEYMARVSAMQEQSLPNTAQFIALAATLLLIKSKSLLPVLDLTEEEEASIEDLELRLKRYKIYRDMAENLMELYGAKEMFTPLYSPPKQPIFHPDQHCTISSLENALADVLNNLPKQVIKPKAKVTKVISLEEMIEKLQKRIEKQLKTRFSEIRRTEAEHKNVIVGFLAILELFKQGDVIISQTSRFADIEIELERTNIPKYY